MVIAGQIHSLEGGFPETILMGETDQLRCAVHVQLAGKVPAMGLHSGWT